MRTSVALLSVSVVGAVGGAWLIGRWAVGLVLLVASVLLATFALFRDDQPEVVQQPPATEEDRFRREVVADLSRKMSGRSA